MAASVPTAESEVTISQSTAGAEGVLSQDQVLETLRQGLLGRFDGARLLVLIPDHTRSLPMPFIFRSLVEILRDAKQLDFMVALGTHPALSMDEINRLVGISAEERQTVYRHIGLLNHSWDDPASLFTDEGSAFFKFLTRTTGALEIDGPAEKKNPRVLYIPGQHCVHRSGSLTQIGVRQLRLSYGFEEPENIHKAIKMMRDAIGYARSLSV